MELTEKEVEEIKNYKPLDEEKYIINYLSDTDVYKISMTQCLLHKRPNEWAKWKWKLRTKDVHLGYLVDAVNREVDHLCTLRWQPFELNALSKIYYIKPDYVDWLEDFRLKRKYIKITRRGEDLEIEAEGPQLKVTWFEIYVMEIIQELYLRQFEFDFDKAKQNLKDAVDKFNAAIDSGLKFTFADFGARRRHSFAWQDYAVGYMAKNCKCFVGTSNLYFAIKYGVKAIGTFAHEMYALFQGLNDVPIRQSQKAVFDAWTQEYRGDLGIALSDNFGFIPFLRDFDKFYAKLFDGCRHDSGDPIIWGEMLIAHYKALGIDPTTKTGCWSDSLDVDKAIKIAQHFNGRIKISFGIGTYFMANLVTQTAGIKPLSMVMKVVKVNGKDVVKLSDCPEKNMCESPTYVEYVKDVFDYIPLDQWKGGMVVIKTTP